MIIEKDYLLQIDMYCKRLKECLDNSIFYAYRYDYRYNNISNILSRIYKENNPYLIEKVYSDLYLICAPIIKHINTIILECGLDSDVIKDMNLLNVFNYVTKNYYKRNLKDLRYIKITKL